MKENKFHGDNYSPGQGKSKKQYEDSAKVAAYAFALLIVLLIVIAIISVIGFITNI
ncbi:MAG: hypothetical protein ACOC2U_04620 [bacterium]